MVYAFLMFTYVLSFKVSGNKTVTELSALFLPVYTIHYFFIKAWACVIDYPYAGVATPLVDYLVVSFITLAVCYLMMKIPYSDKVFRI